MQPDDIIRAIVTAVAFGSLMAGHYAGDQWLQTSAQAAGKALDRPGTRLRPALWNCFKHVLSYTLAGLGLLLLAASWLGLPLRAEWVAAGLAFNAATHFVIDLRAPLRWMIGRVGLNSYVHHCSVVRPAGADQGGPGTALFHLDQAAHFICIFLASLLIAGP